jgi:hypothetical protein
VSSRIFRRDHLWPRPSKALALKRWRDDVSADKHHRRLKALLLRLISKLDPVSLQWKDISEVGHPANCIGGIGIDREVLKARDNGYLVITRGAMETRYQAHARRTFLKITPKGVRLLSPLLVLRSPPQTGR